MTFLGSNEKTETAKKITDWINQINSAIEIITVYKNALSLELDKISQDKSYSPSDVQELTDLINQTNSTISNL